MPPLVMLGRRWLLGSDDFVYPTLIDVAIRVVRLVLAYIWLCENWFIFPCLGTIYTTVYYVGFCVIVQLIVIANALIIYYSGRGGIMEPDARKYVPHLLFVRFVLQIIELLWTSLGTSWLTQAFFKCEGSAENIGNVDGTITANWIFIGLFVFFFVVNVAGSKKLDGKHASSGTASVSWPDPHILPYKETPSSASWERTWRVLFCSFSRKNALVQDGFKQIGQIASYLFDDCGLTPSDVVVGLVLTSIKQKKARQEAHKLDSNANTSSQTQTHLNLPALSKTITSQPTSKIPTELLQEECWNSFTRINRFNQFAVAIHTVVAVYLQKYRPCSIFKKQLKYSTSYLCCREKPFVLKGDCCCFCFTSSLSSFLEQNLNDNKQTTLVHVSFVNSYFKLPYMVVIDHSTKSIVIAVRGSMTRRDVFTDFVADAALMNMIPGIPAHFKCHSGFLQSTLDLKRKLDKCRVITELLNTFPTYNLVTTGNSLGAAAAILLAMMYKPKYPNVKCFGFSTPSFLSQDACEYCNDFVQSVIYGNDMVARLSVRSVKNLLYEIKSTLHVCKTPKYQIQLQMMLKTFCLRKRITAEFDDNPRTLSASDKSRSTSEVSVANSNSPVLPIEYSYGSSFKYTIPQCQAETELSRSELCALYPAGKILHITQSKFFHEGSGELSAPGGSRWSIRWADRTEFSEIIVQSRMFWDHQAARLHRALNYFESLQNTRRPIPTIS